LNWDIFQKVPLKTLDNFLEIWNFDRLFLKLNRFIQVITSNRLCRAPLHEECPKHHHGHKGDPGVTPETCGAVGERVQVILVWVRAPGVGNVSHPQRLGVTRIRP
jgi:hypothetical protein